MENFKGTIGKWVLTQDGEANFFGVNLISTHNKWLMRIQQNGELHAREQEANAKLIAASKDLLEALVEANRFIENITAGKSPLLGKLTKDLITNAINKATL